MSEIKVCPSCGGFLYVKCLPFSNELTENELTEFVKCSSCGNLYSVEQVENMIQRRNRDKEAVDETD